MNEARHGKGDRAGRKGKTEGLRKTLEGRGENGKHDNEDRMKFTSSKAINITKIVPRIS